MGDRSLVDQAEVVKSRLWELEDTLVDRKRVVDNLRQTVAGPEASVTELRDLLTAAAHGDNAISRDLQKLQTDFGKKLNCPIERTFILVVVTYIKIFIDEVEQATCNV